MPASKMLTICGWRSLPASEASFWKNFSARRASSGSLGIASMTLIATLAAGEGVAGEVDRASRALAETDSGSRICLCWRASEGDATPGGRPIIPQTPMRKPCLLLFAFALTACGEAPVWRKDGVDEMTAQRDLSVCRKQAQDMYGRAGRHLAIRADRSPLRPHRPQPGRPHHPGRPGGQRLHARQRLRAEGRGEEAAVAFR